MTDNVVQLAPDVIGDGMALDANLVLEAAVGELDRVVVVGIHTDGSLYVASSHGAETLELVAQAQRHLLDRSAALRGWE